MNYDDAVSILRRIEAGDKSLDQEAVAQAIRILCERWRDALTSVEMQGVEGAPDWASYEMRIWDLGESLRLLMKRRKDWRGKEKLLDSVADVLSNKEYGKGRQTFALLLGDFGSGEYGDTLAAVLDDPEVAGHAVKALTKARIAGHEKAVRRLAEDATGWVRSAAKKYMKVVGTTPSENRGHHNDTGGG